MIQVCSRCGTRWNVRDRQRQWCPRCRGALLPPDTSHQWSSAPTTPGLQPSRPRSGPLLPAGYRWIAVRPGSGPPPRRRRRALGPTPRYAFIPRWGLVDPATQLPATPSAPPRRGPSSRAVRAMLITTIAVFGVAALLHIVRYALLIVNRGVLLNSVVAGLATWVAVVASVGAMFAIVGTYLVLTEWLLARRATAFAHYYQGGDPRPAWELRVGCLAPLMNLALPLTYVVELAAAEGKYRHLRRLIWAWWVLLLLSFAASMFAAATSFPDNTQGIADNTVSFVVAYLLGMAAVVATARLVFAFERTPVERPAHRWVVVPDAKQSRPDSPTAVEREGQEPAA